MANETEVKFRVESFEGVREALGRAGAVFLGSMLQTDRFFDSPQRHLYEGDRGVRLRDVEQAEGWQEGGLDLRPLLTYKGPRSGEVNAKSRLELQTHVDDPEAVEQILEACGLALHLKIQKRRETWRLGECLVELDELPVIGRFVEIEGPDEETIDDVARQLELPGAHVTESYPHLVSHHCDLEDGRGEITFADRGA